MKLYYPLEIDDDVYILLTTNGFLGFWGGGLIEYKEALDNYILCLIWTKIKDGWLGKPRKERKEIIANYWLLEYEKELEGKVEVVEDNSELGEFSDLQETTVPLIQKPPKTNFPKPAKVIRAIDIVNLCIPFYTFTDYGQRRFPSHLLPHLAKHDLTFVLKFAAIFDYMSNKK